MNSKTDRLAPWIVGLAAAVALGGYLFASGRLEGPGFPLDDAWIHQTYARNLAERGEWSFVAGQTSGGSTAPLWSSLLAAGHILGRGTPYAWTYVLGLLGLLGLGLAGEGFFRRETGQGGWLPWAGIFLAGEWHMVWAAGSGMETAWMGALVLLALWALGARKLRWELLGVLIGFMVWVRPDGITLLGPALLVLVLGSKSWGERWMSAARLAVGIALLFAPYLLFNHLVQGSWWPNTFYAKQAEYAALQTAPLLARILTELSLPLIGAGLLLAPGFVYFAWVSLREKRWAGLGAVLWFLGYAGLYAWRLPATYQYGRYLMPAMPVYFVCGVVGVALLVSRMRAGRAGRLSALGWVALIAALWAGFYGLGMTRYSQDVAIIETEMVAAARWVAKNTPEDTLIAAHDIGALGYFSQRDLVDLAGLVSPEVIPFIRDEAEIASYLDQRGVAYLMTFPGWYSKLPVGREILWQSEGEYSPQAGGENMTIYRWRRSD
ncbi:MAG: hypothetical protein JW987_13340 [Anaerolineaceae bacterium]|nr:hypothetical protein [Anaerolineaceae bacterium]